MQEYAWMELRSWSLEFEYWSVAFCLHPNREIQRESVGRPAAWQIIKKTHQYPNQDSNSAQRSWVIQCRLCSFKREVFSLWCFALHFWRYWSGDQENHQRQKSNNETRIPNPQSCAWWVIWQNQPRPKDPNQIHGLQKPTHRHTDTGQFHAWWVESPSPFVQH